MIEPEKSTELARSKGARGTGTTPPAWPVVRTLIGCLIAVCLGVAPARAQVQMVTVDGSAGAEGNGANQLFFPYGVAVDSSGNVYVADGLNFRVQKIEANGTVSTFAKISAAVTAVAVDSFNNVYFSDNTGNIYVGAGATVYASPGTGIAAIAFDSNNNMYVLLNAGTGYAEILEFTSGSQSEFVGADTFDGAPIVGMTIGMHDGTEYLYTYVNGMVNNANPVYGYLPVAIDLSTKAITQLTASNAIPVGGAGLTTAFATTASGNDLYMIADGGSDVEDLNFVASTYSNFAGTGKNGYNGDGVATSSEINQAEGLAVGPTGALYIADTANDLVREVLPALVSIKKTDTLPNFGNPSAVNPTMSKLYMAVSKGNYTDGGPVNDMVVYSTLNDTVLADIPIGSPVQHIAVDSVNNFIYATRFDGNVTVIDSTNDTVNAIVPVGMRPTGIDVDPGYNLAYVANTADTKISVIAGPVRSGNTASAARAAGDLLNLLPLGPLAVDPVRHSAYAVVAGGTVEPDTVNYSLAVIQGHSGGGATLTATESYIPAAISSTLSANSISVDTTSGKVAIADTVDGIMHLYDPTQNTFASFTFPFHPATLAVDSTSEDAFLTDGYGNVGFADLASGFSQQIYTAPDAPLTAMNCGPQGSVVAVDPTAAKGYFTTCDGQSQFQAQLHLFDDVLVEEVATPFTFGNPVGGSGTVSGYFALAVNPADHAVFVSNSTPNNSEMDVINGPTPAARPALSLSPPSIDFGNVGVGQTSTSQVVTVTNEGSAPLNGPALNPLGSPAQINIPAASNHCTPGTTIAVNGSCTFSVSFTFSTTGSIDAGIELLDNAGDTPQLLALTGTGTQGSKLTITLSPSSLPIGKVNAAYPVITFSVANSTGSVELSESGILPSGMTFNGSNAPFTLSGTPKQPGTFTFTVEASDSNGDAGSLALELTVGCQTIAVTPSGALPVATIGTEYNEKFEETGGTGATAFTGKWTTPPGAAPGLIFASGDLKGKPTKAGKFDIRISATDSNNCTGSVSDTLNVLEPAQVSDSEMITVTDATAFPDSPDSEPIMVTDTGIVRAFDPIAISPTPATFNAAHGKGTEGVTYGPVKFTATGGIGALTLSVSGPLPAGIVFRNGSLEGTPSSKSAATYIFDIVATDTDGDRMTVTGYKLTIIR